MLLGLGFLETVELLYPRLRSRIGRDYPVGIRGKCDHPLLKRSLKDFGRKSSGSGMGQKAYRMALFSLHTTILSMSKSKRSRNPDHVRRLNRPSPPNQVIEERIKSLLSSALELVGLDAEVGIAMELVQRNHIFDDAIGLSARDGGPDDIHHTGF